ncbi:hypothetical protein MNEG_9094, partial [Monoraphidium neglectum]
LRHQVQADRQRRVDGQERRLHALALADCQQGERCAAAAAAEVWGAWRQRWPCVQQQRGAEGWCGCSGGAAAVL